jgi:hypothetical protein
LAALLTGGWLRIAKDRIEPYAWSYLHGLERKTERQHWQHHFKIIEPQTNKESLFELPRQKLHGTRAAKALLRSGVRIINRKEEKQALIQFLGFQPKKEIVFCRALVGITSKAKCGCLHDRKGCWCLQVRG